MNTRQIGLCGTRGSTLVGVMIFVTVMSAALAGVLSYSATTQRNSNRQTVYDQARIVADTEMDYLYYVWKQQALIGAKATDTVSALGAAGYLITAGAPFSVAVKNQGLAMAPGTGWKVTRTMTFKPIPGRPDGGASGQVPGTQKLGHNFYFEGRVTVHMDHPQFGPMEYRAGRRFVQTETSLFQNAIYYQDELEAATLGVLVVNGDITCNSDVFLGAQPPTLASPTNDLIIYGKAKIFGQFNGIDIVGDGAIGTVMRKPGSLGSSTLHDPIFDPSCGVSVPSDQTATRVAQVQKLSIPENVLGGVSAPTLVVQTSPYCQAYCKDDPTIHYDWSVDNGINKPDVNSVYRSVIAPPPPLVESDGTTPIVEDPIIASRRMYNRAGIVITLVENPVGTTVMHVGNAQHGYTYYDNIGTVLADMSLVIPNNTTDRRHTMADQRENKDVKVSNVYIDQLINVIASNTDIAGAFNGVIYIHDTTVPPISTGTLSAIRIKNATATPVIRDPSNNQLKGFTLVTENGIYIQGDYNTVTPTSMSSGHFNPCAIMADAITVLSPGFVDHQLSGAATLAFRPASANITINSALVSGNTASGTGTTSGGVQNLVRYLEDWTGKSATFHGSLSELYRSYYFSTVYTPNGLAGNVYMNPTPRNFDFDNDLADTPPALSPKASSYFRGEHFTF